jgi:flagellar FliJ protein
MHAGSLATLVEIARRERDAALSRQGELEHSTERARQSLHLLRGYTDDYLGRARPREGDVRDPGAEENRRNFLAKLGVAVRTQEQDVQIREQVLQRARGEAQDAERRLRSLETLLQRRAQQELEREERREQKNTDEIAQRGGLPGFAPTRPQETT